MRASDTNGGPRVRQTFSATIRSPRPFGCIPSGWLSRSRNASRRGPGSSPKAARHRQIGPIGTLVRVVLGLVLLLFGVIGGQIIVINGQLRSHVELLSLILGVVALPVLLLGLQWVRARLAPARL